MNLSTDFNSTKQSRLKNKNLYFNSLSSLFLIIFALYLSACTSARINQFNLFAKAGTQYVDLANLVIDESGDAAIDADSAILKNIRDPLPEDKRAERLQLHNEQLQKRLQLLNEIKEHNLLLRSYFVQLSALAESNAPSSIGETAKATANNLVEVGNIISDGSFGGDKIGGIVEPVATIIVAQYQNAALEKELKARSDSIANELEIQRAAMKALTTSMQSNYALLIQEKERIQVIEPFVKEGNQLPAKWSERRKEVLKTNVKIESVKAAEKAADDLKKSFIALVENRFTLADLELLIQDINRIASLIEAIKGEQKKEKTQEKESAT